MSQFPYNSTYQEFPMDRDEREHPSLEGRTVQRLKHPVSQVATWEKTIPRHEIPPGYRVYVRWVDALTMEMGLEPDGAVKAAQTVGDGLDTKSLPDLKSIAGREGVLYDVKTLKGDLVQKIRAKRLEAKP